MMSVSSLDTHELVKDLKSAGFTDEQAEAVTRAVKQAQQIDLSDLATKADLSALGARLDNRLDNIDARMANFVTKAELADTRTELIKWVVGIAFAQVAAILAILKLFPGGHP